MAMIICKLKLFNFFFLFFHAENDGRPTLPLLRGRVSILRKRTNILVVNDSISKSSRPSKFSVGGEKPEN